MMYQNKFVVAVKVNGKVLRENKNIVNLPFGSEYSILLKNLNSVRALVSVSIDGQEVTEGTRLILQPNQSLDLERYIRNGNLNKGNKFKFIERTTAIEEHRGIKEDDGLVRVEFWPEKVSVVRTHYYDEYIPIRRYYDHYPHWCGTYQYINSGSWQSNQFFQSNTLSKSTANVTCSINNSTVDTSLNDNGITVAGSESNQQFSSGSWFATESQSEVIVLQLKGQNQGQMVIEPVTVQYKTKCITCGRTNKANAKFCSQCGTATAII